MKNGAQPIKIVCERERMQKKKTKEQANAKKQQQQESGQRSKCNSSTRKQTTTLATRTKKHTSNSPLATFSARTMNCSLHNALQTSAASCRFSKRGILLGHLVPFLGSCKKSTSFSPEKNKNKTKTPNTMSYQLT